jgi:uncharacterized repeat protein (TIGR03803 family)
MEHRKPFLVAGRPLVIFVAILMIVGNAWAADSKGGVIYRLQGGNDGDRPFAGLIADQAGNLYGTTYNGGGGPYFVGCCGTVFEVSPPAAPGDPWTETVLYSFQGGTDGGAPDGSLVFDQTGNLYGTTTQGGQNAECPNCGTVFELTPPANVGGAWTETILHRFTGLIDNSDGAGPIGALVFDKAGNLYGTTYVGGLLSDGTVFQLSPPTTPGGSWTETTIYGFRGRSDGLGPQSGLIIDEAGALYGTTNGGGNLRCNQAGGGCGVVFRLVPPNTPGDPWSEQVLLAFGDQAGDGRFPVADLVPDKAGNLYGMTPEGGSHNAGTVFQLTRPARSRDPWTETVLYNFERNSNGYPQAGLKLDEGGALYGTTAGPGGLACPPACGTVFRLSPPATIGGAWTETVLHKFIGGTDGAAPYSDLLRVGGVFYGTTIAGGAVTSTCPVGCGTVFKLAP